MNGWVSRERERVCVCVREKGGERTGERGKERASKTTFVIAPVKCVRKEQDCLKYTFKILT